MVPGAVGEASHGVHSASFRCRQNPRPNVAPAVGAAGRIMETSNRPCSMPSAIVFARR
jgi:hypothetical protein